MLGIHFNLKKITVFVLSLLPFLYIVYSAITQTLGADPQKVILLTLGEWTLRFLLITLSLSVLRRRLNFRSAIQYRRMLGLFAMFYASLHLLSYYTFYLAFSFSDLSSEIIERPYLVLGFLAWLLLIPLTITSTKYAMKRLKKNWQKLHYAIYLIIILVWVHFFWQVKSDINEALAYGLIILILLGERVFYHWKKRKKAIAKAQVNLAK